MQQKVGNVNNSHVETKENANQYSWYSACRVEFLGSEVPESFFKYMLVWMKKKLRETPDNITNIYYSKLKTNF